jgi:hypothetical protein
MGAVLTKPVVKLKLISYHYFFSSYWGYSGRDIRFTMHRHLVPRASMLELHLHSPMPPWRCAYLIKPYYSFLGVKGGRPARKADNFTAICEPIV